MAFVDWQARMARAARVIRDIHVLNRIHPIEARACRACAVARGVGTKQHDDGCGVVLQTTRFAGGEHDLLGGRFGRAVSSIQDDAGYLRWRQRVPYPVAAEHQGAAKGGDFQSDV